MSVFQYVLLQYVLLTSAMLGLAANAAAQEHRGVTYSLPNNWREVVQGDNKLLIPNGLRQGESVVALVMPAEATSPDSPSRQFDAWVVSTNAELKVLGTGEVASASLGGGTLLLQAFQVEATDIGAHGRIYAMFVEGRRRAPVIGVFKPNTLRSRYEGAMVGLLESIRLKADLAPPPAVSGQPKTTVARAPTGSTPIGETPDLYPGLPGWLPSGRGIAIPQARLVDGKPEGLWWSTAYGDGRRAMTFIFLPNGVQASNPRFGSGNLFDLEGQRRQPGSTGVGTFSIAGSAITTERDGFRSTDPYNNGTDASGPFFKIGGGTYRPLAAPTRSTITGTWTTGGTRYIFHPDGSYEMGQVASGAGWVAGSRVTGTYALDGHLVVLRSNALPVTVTPIGFAGRDTILINGLLYQRS